MTPDEALLQVRLAQIAAAAAALRVPGAPLEPILTRFADRVIDRLAIGTQGDLASMELSVLVGGAGIEDEIDVVLADAGYDPDARSVVEDVRTVLGEPPTDLALRAGRSSGPATLRVTCRGPWSSRQVYELLGGLFVDDPVRVAYDRLVGRFGVDRPTRFAVAWDAPEAPLRIEVGFAVPVDAAAGFAARVDRTGEALGIAPAVRTWLGGVAPALTPPALVTFGLSREALAGWLRVGFPDVPARLVLRLLGQLHPADGAGTALGALMGAFADTTDRVDHLDVEIGPGDDLPRLALSLVRAGPP